MPQAAIAGPLITAGVTTATAYAIAYQVQLVLINLAIGSLEFRDGNGELWVAVDE